MKTNIDKLLSKECFEYGNHIIEVTIKIIKDHNPRTRKYIHNIKRLGDAHYMRLVNVNCFEKESHNNNQENTEPDISEYTLYILDEQEVTEEEIILDNPLPFMGPIETEQKTYYKKYTIREQVKQTCQAVLEELDELGALIIVADWFNAPSASITDIRSEMEKLQELQEDFISIIENSQYELDKGTFQPESHNPSGKGYVNRPEDEFSIGLLFEAETIAFSIGASIPDKPGLD